LSFPAGRTTGRAEVSRVGQEPGPAFTRPGQATPLHVSDGDDAGAAAALIASKVYVGGAIAPRGFDTPADWTVRAPEDLSR
jgi:hypothetical protein